MACAITTGINIVDVIVCIDKIALVYGLELELVMVIASEVVIVIRRVAICIVRGVVMATFTVVVLVECRRVGYGS